jgi:hypothetical protein
MVCCPGLQHILLIVIEKLNAFPNQASKPLNDTSIEAETIVLNQLTL